MQITRPRVYKPIAPQTFTQLEKEMDEENILTDALELNSTTIAEAGLFEADKEAELPPALHIQSANAISKMELSGSLPTAKKRGKR